jgi:oxygen-independent coproporphyrinogen III oxidase
MAGLYLHIPFCKQACHYCDFHFSTNLTGRDEIIKAIGAELRLQREYLSGEKIKTIYFGGGTPSLLTSIEIEYLFNVIHSDFLVDKNLEITFEANPDDLSHEKLVQLIKSGVNRLSIGIQSFDDSVLSFLNRAHSSSSAIQCVKDAYQVGFKNISLDLIYAIPGQSMDCWIENIHAAIALQPQHISSYSLTIEEKTVFGRWSAKGKLNVVDDDSSAEQLEILMTLLERAGYDQYEAATGNVRSILVWAQVHILIMA